LQVKAKEFQPHQKSHRPTSILALLPGDVSTSPRLKCVRRVHGPPSEVEFTFHAQDRMAAASSATPICYERVSTRPESANQGQIFSIDAKNTVFTPLFALTTTAKLAAKEAG